MKRFRLLIWLAAFSLAGCASQPKPAETAWVTVVDIYSAKAMQQSFNKPVAKRFMQAGFSVKDIEDGRMLRVACGLGTDYTWGSYAYLPTGMRVEKDEVVRLRIDEPTTDERMGLNPVMGRVEGFRFPGALHAHRYIPDWKERGLYLNFERTPLQPEQQGRYVISHGSYVIKCRQRE